MIPKYKYQQLDIPAGWTVVQNEFYDIDPKDNVPEDDKVDLIYCQEDLLYLTKGDYLLDLGWYGYDNLASDTTGEYCIHLFRGDWKDGELLEKFRSRDKLAIANKISELIKTVDLGGFDNLTGYRLDENDPANKNNFSDMDNEKER